MRWITSSSTPLRLSAFAFIALSTLASTGSGLANAQDFGFSDPTVESPEIQAQLEAVRGVKSLSQLRERIENLEAENAKLIEQLEAMLMASEKLTSELESMRANRQADQQQRLAIPELRLVAQVQTPLSGYADISAGGRLYRVTSESHFTLLLSNGQTVLAQARFLPEGDVEVVIPQLEVTYRLAFRPSVG